MLKWNLTTLFFFIFLVSTAHAGTCNWKFHVRNNTDGVIDILKVSTKVGIGTWKKQWESVSGQTIHTGVRALLSRTGDLGVPQQQVPVGYSFETDTACNENKNIDFKVIFRCGTDSRDTEYTRKALNMVRDGKHTVRIYECTDYTS